MEELNLSAFREWIHLQEIQNHLTYHAGWNNREEVWKSADSFY